MAEFEVHERLYRGEEALATIAAARVVICGAGAVGSNLAEGLARQGFQRLRVIDRDRVEERNLGTQVYEREDVGTLKAEALHHRVYRATGLEIEAVPKELAPDNAAKLLAGAEVIVDGFDNRAAREAVALQAAASGSPCLHVGFAAGFAEVRWNEHYRVPSGRGEDVCDYPLARNLVILGVAVAAETLLRFVVSGEKRDYSLTLADLRIHAEE